MAYLARRRHRRHRGVWPRRPGDQLPDAVMKLRQAITTAVMTVAGLNAAIVIKDIVKTAVEEWRKSRR